MTIPGPSSSPASKPRALLGGLFLGAAAPVPVKTVVPIRYGPFFLPTPDVTVYLPASIEWLHFGCSSDPPVQLQLSFAGQSETIPIVTGLLTSTAEESYSPPPGHPSKMRIQIIVNTFNYAVSMSILSGNPITS